MQWLRDLLFSPEPQQSPHRVFQFFLEFLVLINPLSKPSPRVYLQHYFDRLCDIQTQWLSLLLFYLQKPVLFACFS